MDRKQQIIFDAITNQFKSGDFKALPSENDYKGTTSYRMKVPFPQDAKGISYTRGNMVITAALAANGLEPVDWRHGDPIDIQFIYIS